MRAAQRIVEALKGKRDKVIWELILKVTGNNEDNIPLETESEFGDYIDSINKKSSRWLIFEDYNFPGQFSGAVYGSGSVNLNHKEPFRDIHEDYFSDAESVEDIIVIDLLRKKAYQIIKHIEYKFNELEVEDEMS